VDLAVAAFHVLNLIGANERVVDLRITVGTLVTGYRLWSGYIVSASFASPRPASR